MKDYEPVPAETLAAVARAAAATGPIESWSWYENANAGGGVPSFYGGVEEVTPRVFGDGTTGHVTLMAESETPTIRVELGSIGEAFANYVEAATPAVVLSLAREVLSLRAELAGLRARLTAAEEQCVADLLKKDRTARGLRDIAR